MTSIKPVRDAADDLTSFTRREHVAAARSPDDAWPLFFGPAEKPLFGWHHPGRGFAVRTSAVVLCPPLGYEYMCSHRAFRCLAERLAAAGFHVLRFDYHGTGDSSGGGCACDAGQVASWIDSIRCAIDELRARSGASQVSVVGMRLGATLAAAAVAHRADVDGLVLWHPCPSGKSYAREVRALGMAGLAEEAAARKAPPVNGAGTGIEAAGFSLSPSTVAELAALDLLRMRGNSAPPAALVIARDDLSRDETLARHLRSCGAATTQQWLPGYASMMMMPLQSVLPEAAIDAIVGWLSAAHDARAPAVERAPAYDPVAPATAVVPVAATTVLETPALFGPRGRRLFGMLTEPAQRRRGAARPAVVLLNTGGDHHVGPHRLYVPLARDWAALGFTVLRFDLAGLGESQAEDGVAGSSAYPRSALDDIRSAMDFLWASRGIDRIILAGMCSGGYHALHATRAGLPIIGRIAINPPLYWRPGDPVDVDRSWNHYEMNRIARALFKRSRWLKALRGDVDFKYIGGVIATKATTVASSNLSRVWRIIGATSDESRECGELRTLLPPDVDTFLVYSGGDPGLTYIERCAGPSLARWRVRPTFRLDVVEGADHTFMAVAWQERLRALLTDYLVERHGAG